MTIEAFILCWNEAETLHLTLRHYKTICNKITVFDNFSTDRSREIAEEYGAEVRLFGIEGQLNDAEYLKVKNSCWKGSDADWVIVCDADEIFCPCTDDLFNAKMNAFSIINTEGFNMFSEQMPSNNWFEINTGIPDSNYSKLVCFNPKFLSEIGYVYGCHEARPKGHIRYSEEIGVIPKLLHYKHVGGAKRLADRHALYASRLAPINKKWGLGKQYEEPRQKTIDYFNENLAKVKIIF